MARKKKIEDTAPKKAGEPVLAPEPPAAPAEPKKVKFEGAEVVEVLQDGRETPTHFHCKMSDGTTMHVPKELFQ